MRCLTLARTLRNRGATCHFICREHPGDLVERIRQDGFEVVSLPVPQNSDPSPVRRDKTSAANEPFMGLDWRADADQTIATLREHRTDWLIVDHYALDHRWESQVRPYCSKIMVIDDLANRPHDCDLLLDQNLIADKEYRYNKLLPANCARLLGPRYALLQRNYAELRSQTPPRSGPVQRILVYFGGADNQNLTGMAMAAFMALNRTDIALDVVVNPASRYAPILREQAQPHTNITLYDALPSLAHLMVQADLAIGAAGATSWERCCLGLPALVVTLAENQIPIATELDRLRLARWLGDKNAVSALSLQYALLDALSDEDPLFEWSTRCRAPVDGRGAERVAELLLLNSNTTLSARLACLDDELLLLTWANDSVVRQNAFCSDPITPQIHRVWFYKRLRDQENCQIFILETVTGMPIGQVRFERSDDAWEISYSLAAEVRGRGLGSRLLQSAILAFRKSRKDGLVFGRVKPGNLASRKVFENLGFAASTAKGGEVVYRYSL